uniref:Ground-like domain-containing protein n=1 Tax=Meloidogyne incognita TaxID=6306 RepID=A0A914M7Q9_MELIC
MQMPNNNCCNCNPLRQCSSSCCNNNNNNVAITSSNFCCSQSSTTNNNFYYLLNGCPLSSSKQPPNPSSLPIYYLINPQRQIPYENNVGYTTSNLNNRQQQLQQPYNNLIDKLNIGSYYPIGGGGGTAAIIPQFPPPISNIQIPPTVYIIGNNPLSGIEEKGENTTTSTTQKIKETTISFSSSSELPPTENKSEGGNTTTATESTTLSTTTIEEIKEQQQNTTTIITTVTTTLGENETKISNATEPVKVEKRNDNQQEELEYPEESFENDEETTKIKKNKIKKRRRKILATKTFNNEGKMGRKIKRKRKRILSTKTSHLINKKCNSKILAKAINYALIGDNLSIAKRFIRRSVERKFEGEKFKVFCKDEESGDFNNLINFEEEKRKFCQITKGLITCIVIFD